MGAVLYEEKKLMQLSYIEEVLGERGYSTHARRKKRVHGGPDSRLPRQIIEAYGLKRGSKVRLFGVVHVVRDVKGDEVFVEGIRARVNVYQLTPVE